MTNMKNVRILFFASGILAFLTSLFLLYNYHLMQVEDQYGDLQQVYFDGESGDVIVNNTNGKTGILLFEKGLVFVVSGSEKKELNEWFGRQAYNGYYLFVYRNKSLPDIKSLSANQLAHELQRKQVSLVVRIDSR
ncbi:hypothetical protein [Flavobacterium silvaticum]|uniref:Uncharacterized protein n=1 Tax=Flavobacterium silvaticum TaxID=1852020 RepID=A0A972JJI6_9FLAO|nr:hypothetical protein [Flavobacterium silvaticum]NMH29398.1 hypothetical protein [Flavobacterium silvaticum]